jgi:hypothetical protein
MYLGKRGPRPKHISSSLALVPDWRPCLRAQALRPSGMVDRNEALRWSTSSPSCRGLNATSVGHSRDKGERYGISEPAPRARKTYV